MEGPVRKNWSEELLIKKVWCEVSAKKIKKIDIILFAVIDKVRVYYRTKIKVRNIGWTIGREKYW